MRKIRNSIWGQNVSVADANSEPIEDPFDDNYVPAPGNKDHTGNVAVQATEVYLERHKSALPECAKHSKFEWKELNVFVGDIDGKQILFDSNCCIESGQLLAVMGGSGAGKSTLLNALSGRTNLNEQRVNGYLAINGKKFKCADQKIIKSLCTYVPQSDILCPTQTVEEALLFYAKLKSPHLTLEKQRKRINYLIHVLHLGKCRNNIIGSESKRGISGGEKRRVSIASEILNDADIIFLDEPTSGLDAYTAARTIKTLKQFCFVSNKIIIATIHQPSIEVFYLFDKLLLLSNGKCCFDSLTKDIEIFFEDAIRPKTNPADVIIFEVQRKPEEYAQEWTVCELNQYKNVKSWNEYVTFDESISKRKASKLLQYKLLLTREFKAMKRDLRVSLIRLAQVLFFALICGILYLNIKDNFENKARCFFLLGVIPILFGMVSLLTAFPKQKLLFQREYASGTYDVTTWALTHIIVELPRDIIHMIIFTFIAYNLINLDGNFMDYFITLFLTTLSGGSFGLFFGTITRTTVEAAQTVPAAFIPLLIFSDALISLENFPQAVQWISKIDPLYYIIRCFYIIEFKGVEYATNLTSDQKQLCNTCQELQNNAMIPPEQNTTSIQTTDTTALDEFCSATYTGEQLFNRKDINGDSLYMYWMIIVLICCVLRFLSVLILLVINNNGFSWISNKISRICTCHSENNNKQYVKKQKKMDNINVSMNEENMKLQMNSNANNIIEIEENDELEMVEEEKQMESKNNNTIALSKPQSVSISSKSKRRKRTYPHKSVNKKIAIASHDFAGGYRPYELTFYKGWKLIITMEGENGWVWGHYESEPTLDGWFPISFINIIEIIDENENKNNIDANILYENEREDELIIHKNESQIEKTVTDFDS